MRRIFRSMSYANIAATLALFLAIGGGGAVAVAASTTGGHPLPATRAHAGGERGPQGPRGPRGFRGPRGRSGYCKGCTATGATGAQGAAGPKGATGATGATGPAGAANPNATNSAALGGVAAAGFVQNACGVVDGAVKGFVSVPASGTFSSTFTDMSGYNCSGQAVQARRVATGVYDVQFLGSPVTVAVGNVLLPSIDYNATPNTASVSIAQEGPGEFRVVIESLAQGNALLDLPFDLVTP